MIVKILIACLFQLFMFFSSTRSTIQTERLFSLSRKLIFFYFLLIIWNLRSYYMAGQSSKIECQGSSPVQVIEVKFLIQSDIACILSGISYYKKWGNLTYEPRVAQGNVENSLPHRVALSWQLLGVYDNLQVPSNLDI